MGKWSDIARQENNPHKWSQLKMQEQMERQQKEKIEAEKEQADLTWKQAFKQSFGNIPASALEFGKSLATPIMHPIDTSAAMGHLFAGAVQKLTPGIQEDEKYADAFSDFMKSRYGSIENFKRTIAADPVGVTTDIATILMAGGAAIRAVGAGTKAMKLGATAGAISKIGKASESVGAAMEPINVIRRIASLPARIIPRAVPSKLYQSGVKFATKLSKEERAAITATALEKEIMPTVRGLNKLRDQIDDYNAKISQLVDDASVSGSPVAIDRLFDDFPRLENRYALSGNLQKIRSVEQRFKEGYAAKGISKIDVKQAQRLKQDLHAELYSYWNQVMQSPADVVAKKAIAGQARQIVEEFIPGIKQLNQEEGALIALWDALEKPANRISNRDLMGIGVPMKTATGGIIGDVPGAAVGLAAGILDTPQVKAKIAMVLDRLRREGIKVGKGTAFLKLLGAESGKISNLE